MIPAHVYATLLLISAITLTGCVIGNGRICGPQTALAYCDAEAEQRLLHPTPLRDEWEKSDASSAARQLDWVACGGHEDGGYRVGFETEGSAFSAARKVYYGIQRCMLQHGYTYIGRCDNAISMAQPKCGAP